MADQYKVVHGLSKRAILNDLERLQTHISRSGHSLTLNISEMAKDAAIVAMAGEYIGNHTQLLSNGTIFSDLK